MAEPEIGPMTQLLPFDQFSLEVADDAAKGAFIVHLLEGKGPREAARLAKSELISLYLARCADAAFSDLWHLAELARRDVIVHETLAKAMAATGVVIEDWLRDPDTGDMILDADFNPVRAPRLIGGNTGILSKLLEKVLASADKPVPAAMVQVSNNVGNELPAMPVLVYPEDGDA